MKPQLIALIAVLFLFSSCEKKMHTTIVSGKVINEGSKQPIDSVLVTLLDGVSTAGEIIPGNTSSGKKNIAYTDKEGNFRVEITGEYDSFLALSKARYEAPHGGLVTSVSAGVHENMVYAMKSVSEFCGVYKSTLPGLEELRVIFLDQGFIGDTCWTLSGDNNIGWQFRFYEDRPFSICERNILTNIYGDRYLKFRLRILRDSTWETKIDSVYLKGFETYHDTIYY